jgi:hypothetical protein
MLHDHEDDSGILIGYNATEVLNFVIYYDGIHLLNFRWPITFLALCLMKDFGNANMTMD